MRKAPLNRGTNLISSFLFDVKLGRLKILPRFSPGIHTKQLGTGSMVAAIEPLAVTDSIEFSKDLNHTKAGPKNIDRVISLD